MKNKEELKKAVKILSEFVDDVPGGESYWIDPEGNEHNADMGYVCEFLLDLENYLDGNWKPKESIIALRYPPNYTIEILLTNGDFKIFNCQSFRLDSDIYMIEANPINIIRCYKRDISHIWVTDLKTMEKKQLD